MFELVAQRCNVPSSQATRSSMASKRMRHDARDMRLHSPPAIVLASKLYAQAVTFVLPPRSFDLATMTVFCFIRSAVFHMRMVESFDDVMNSSDCRGCQQPAVMSATWPLSESCSSAPACDHDRSLRRLTWYDAYRGCTGHLC